MYLPDKIIKVLLTIGYKTSDNIADYWFENRIKVETALRKYFTDTDIQKFANQIRWKSKAGIECQKVVRSHIETEGKGIQGHLQDMLINKSISDIKEFPISVTDKIIDFSLLTFEFEGNTIPVTSFQDMYGNFKIYPKTNLAGIDLHGIKIKHCSIVNTCFMDANFEDAEIEIVTLKNSTFQSATFKNARLIQIKFNDSNMVNANVEGAFINAIILNDFKLNYCEVTYWYLIKCLFLSLLWSGHLGENPFVKRKHTVFLYIDTQQLTSPDNLSFKSYIDWYQYIFIKLRNIKEVKITEKVLFSLSLVFTKSWTSYAVLASFAVLVNMIFALIYSLNYECMAGLDDSLFTAFYYSIVTFTTLGYGEIYPMDTLMRFVVIIEVILGYITLGSFVFLIGHKVNDRF